VAFLVHRWLFKPGFKGSIGSRKEMLVDDLGNLDSIFEKARFILRKLPAWMMPAGFNWKKHDNFCQLVNPANGATITGEAGDNMGRGGRSSVYIVDEAAFIERPLKVDSAISQNSNVLIYVSTANGTGNPFYAKRMSGEWRVFTFHWRDDPRKDQAWYEEQKRKLDPIIVAQEIDIDYTASQEGIIIPRGWLEGCTGRPLYKAERGAIAIGVDIAEEGNDNSAVVIREGRNILHAEEWHGHDTVGSVNELARIGNEWQKKLAPGHKLYFFIDKIGVGSGVVAGLNEHIRQQKKADPPVNLPWVVVPVHVGEESPDERCRNLKAALWWRCREWFDGQEPAISTEIPRSIRDKLINQLSVVTYQIKERGLIEIEPKTSLKKRGVKSPDMADALIHTFKWEAMKPKGEETADEYYERKRREKQSRGDGSWMSN
jgi:hypothetical protein